MSGRFDWYQATVDVAEIEDVRPLMGTLVDATICGGEWEPMARAPHGFGFGSRLVDADGAVCQVWWGGCHHRPHVVSSGERANAVAEVLRGRYAGRHRVTRADACIDYADPGAYERLQGIALGVAQECKVKVGTAGDHLLRHEGRTLYLGAPSSHTRLRIYDKADELRDKFRRDPALLSSVPDELARLECQVRPQTAAAKLAAALLDPVSLMGSSRWMRELMRRVAGLELAPFEAGKPWRQADDDRAYSALLAQYGGMLQRMRNKHGGWEVVGLQIGSDLVERRRP